LICRALVNSASTILRKPSHSTKPTTKWCSTPKCRTRSAPYDGSPLDLPRDRRTQKASGIAPIAGRRATRLPTKALRRGRRGPFVARLIVAPRQLPISPHFRASEHYSMTSSGRFWASALRAQQATPHRVIANRPRGLAHSSTQDRCARRCARALMSRLGHALC
jgi:hypothetical protein